MHPWLPDVGMTTLKDVTEDVRRIAMANHRPFMVDADTGCGNAFSIARTIRELSRAGATGCQIEEQVQAKRCRHRSNKKLVDPAEMVDRLKAAAEGRTDSTFVLVARTDAVAEEGVEPARERCEQYVEAGAVVIFAEAVTTLDDYRRLTQHLSVPALANLIEFGRIYKLKRPGPLVSAFHERPIRS
jgi:methylisocitrate lyase